MSTADIVLLVIIIIGAYSGYKNGFLMGVFSLAAILLGIFLGFKLMGWGMVYLQDRFNADKAILPYLSFGIIFLIVVIVVNLIGKALKSTVDKTFLGTMDQVMGSALGAFKTIFMLSVVLWITDSLHLNLPPAWVEGSWLYPFTAHLAPAISSWLGDIIPFFREIFPHY